MMKNATASNGARRRRCGLAAENKVEEENELISRKPVWQEPHRCILISGGHHLWSLHSDRKEIWLARSQSDHPWPAADAVWFAHATAMVVVDTDQTHQGRSSPTVFPQTASTG
jgi:hypothetical protein